MENSLCIETSKGQTTMNYSAKDWNKAQIKVEKIADLVLDWRLYPRKEIDQQVVETYAKALQADSVFPSVNSCCRKIWCGKEGSERLNAETRRKSENRN